MSQVMLSEELRRVVEWEYFQLPPPEYATIELVRHDDNDEGMVEPVLVATDFNAPSVINTQINGKPGFATGDLLQPHPTVDGWYRIYGRADEQIMLSTGEKTNPVPLGGSQPCTPRYTSDLFTNTERMLHESPEVAIAIFFGRGRLNNGVLVQPMEPFNPKDEQKVAAFRNKIWPTVQKMNGYAPAHSRLLKEVR
jgi:hypothetical protein